MADRYALVVANGDYQDPKLPCLKAPVQDAKSLVELLANEELGGYSVTELIDQPRRLVEREIQRLFSDKRPDDLILLYFSGHGVRDEDGQLFLAVADSERSMLDSSAVAASFVTKLMDRSRSKRQLLILDCCHSGAFAPGVKAEAAVGAVVGVKSAFEGNGYGRVVLTASDATQYAWEGDRIHGSLKESLFTHCLIEGIRTGDADRDGDGKINVDELFDYAYDKVRSLTQHQTPGKWSFRQQGEVFVAFSPKSSGTKLPAHFLDALRSPLSSVREAAAKDLAQLLKGQDRQLALAAEAALRGLLEDDSRSVAKVAEAALAAFAPGPKPEPAKAPIVPPPPPSPVEPELAASVAQTPAHLDPPAPFAWAGAEPVERQTPRWAIPALSVAALLFLVFLGLRQLTGEKGRISPQPDPRQKTPATNVEREAQPPDVQPATQKRETAGGQDQPKNAAMRGLVPVPSPGSSKPSQPAEQAQAEQKPQASTAESAPGRLRIGGSVMAAKVVHQPKPVYPPIARQAGIQGTVRMSAIIGKDGTIQSLEILGGHPLLLAAAQDAVRQWRYAATLLNGVPVEVITQIDVNFSLQAEQKAPAPPTGLKAVAH